MNNLKNNDIDFVITYVDDSDIKWRKKRNKYSGVTDVILNKRFRSWDNLRYWFRCVAKYAPWVHKIFLVTDDQCPSWLNLDNKKIVHVNHSDYIPKKYLPVFSANPIETNLHRIKGLSERFVFFNDDTFITAPVDPEFFFKDGLPCDYPVETNYGARDNGFYHILVNDLMAINKNYNRKEVLKKHADKFYAKDYPSGRRKNLYRRLSNNDKFIGFENLHLPSCMLKTAFKECWKDYAKELDETCKNRFRTSDDLNQYIFSYYLYVNGMFSPINWRDCTVSYQLNDTCSNKNNIYIAADQIVKNKMKLMCLNDAYIEHFENTKNTIKSAFDTVVPDYCEFEKEYDKYE